MTTKTKTAVDPRIVEMRDRLDKMATTTDPTERFAMAYHLKKDMATQLEELMREDYQSMREPMRPGGKIPYINIAKLIGVQHASIIQRFGKA